MDTPTHALIGATVGGAVRSLWPDKPLARAAPWIGIVGGVLPDIDLGLLAIDQVLGTGIYWQHHRGITHSFLGTAALALGAAFLLRRLGRVRAFLACWAALLLHVWFDVLTSYGTMVLAPFSDRRFALDLLCNTDLVYTGTLLLGGLRALKNRRAAATMALFALLYPALLLYPRAGIRTAAEERHPQASRIEVIPQPGAPWRYSATAVVGDTLHWAVGNGFLRRLDPPLLYPRFDESHPRHADVHAHAWGRIFLALARVPAFKEHTLKDGRTALDLYCLRLQTDIPLFDLDERRFPHCRMIFDAKGELVEALDCSGPFLHRPRLLWRRR